MREEHAGAQGALDGGSGKIRAGGARGKGRDVQALAHGAIPVGRIGGVFKGDAAAGEVLREPAPGSEIELIGGLELGEIAFQAGTLGQQPEDAPLVEDVDVILPDHVVDGAQLAAVSDEQGGQTCETVAHQLTSGSRTETANPARKTG